MRFSSVPRQYFENATIVAYAGFRAIIIINVEYVDSERINFVPIYLLYIHTVSGTSCVFVCLLSV